MELLLEEKLDEGTASSLKAKLDEMINKKQDIKINAEKVSYITSPCIQIIFNAGMSCSIHGINFEITKKSNVVKRAFREIGLKNFIEQFK